MSGMHHYRIIDDVLVAGTVGKLPEDDNWWKFIEDLTKAPITKYLNVAFGNIDVTSLQRKAVFDQLAARKLEVAVVTDSLLVRGIVNAAQWFDVQNVKAFKWQDIDKAFEYLKISTLTARRINEVIEQFKAAAEKVAAERS